MGQGRGQNQSQVAFKLWVSNCVVLVQPPTVALVQRDELGAEQRRPGHVGEVVHSREVVPIRGVVLRRDDPRAELGVVAHFDAVRDDDLLDAGADARELVDALQHLLDQPRRRVGPAEWGGWVGACISKNATQ